MKDTKAILEIAYPDFKNFLIFSTKKIILLRNVDNL